MKRRAFLPTLLDQELADKLAELPEQYYFAKTGGFDREAIDRLRGRPASGGPCRRRVYQIRRHVQCFAGLRDEARKMDQRQRSHQGERRVIPTRFGEFQALRADGSLLTREEHFAFVDLLKSTPPASPLFPREYPGDIPALELLPRPLNLSRKCSKIHAMSNSRSV